MITTIIHDVFGTRTVKNNGGQVEESYVIKENVHSPFYINEFDIKAATPKHNKKGNKYRNQLIIITQEDSYVIKETFNDLMELIEKGRPGRVGFTLNGKD